MSQKVRVRFAPSPTGALHIGGVRTALYNYLFAKQQGGTFILRIEDTDQNRYVDGAEDYIINSLNWCGIPFDEGPGKEAGFGPYRQSERKHIYASYAQKLIETNQAYYAFDSNEALDAHRKEHEQKGKTFIYNWHNRLKLENSLSLNPEETKTRLAGGADYVIRFKSPQDQKLLVHDTIRGSIEIDSNVLDDKVLFKSDGMPTYHLANIVDDHLMQITHVIRGEEWLPSMPLHQLLYAAYGWTPPTFAHLPLIMKPEGKGKLSKRDGEKMGFPVFPLAWGDTKGYREEGYFPEAVVNFLALLGWNPGTEQEIFDIKELIANFSLERVHKSGARFDPEKTKWYNYQYLQQKTDEVLTESYLPILTDHLSNSPKNSICFDLNSPASKKGITRIIHLIKERAALINDLWDLSNYFFLTPEAYDSAAVSKQWKSNTSDILRGLYDVLEELPDFSASLLEAVTKNWIAKNEYSFGQIMPPLRLAIVGALKGPHLFDIMEVIGKKEALLRLNNALDRI